MANESVWYQIGRAIREIIIGAGKAKPSGGSGQQGPAKSTRSTLKPRSTAPESTEASPGQYGAGQTRDITAAELRAVKLEYAPRPDGDPDPGEVVWTWVPYVENDGRGKDRPVLVIGRIDASTVVGCYLSTKDHRGFIPIGTGDWDPQGRESFLSPERLLRVTHDGMRREGVQIDRKRFDAAVAGVRAYHGLK